MEKVLEKTIEQIESTSGSGFSDWKIKASNLGDRALLSVLRGLDSEPNLSGDRNAHHYIYDRLKDLALPTQDCTFVPLADFIENPSKVFEGMPKGDYYFVSIKPGKHLAHALNENEVIDFIESYYNDSSSGERNREVFISHNGEAVMSGHIIVKEDEGMSRLSGEFTIGNFNAFHRGFTTPEIVLERDRLNKWTFMGSLSGDDWRNSEEFECFGGTKMSRLDMAGKIQEAISHIPKDEKFLLPGYYEVLFEKTSNRIKPVFIEAVV